MGREIPALEIDRIRTGEGGATADAIYSLWKAFNDLLVQSTPATEGTGTFANQPALTPGDAGFIYNVTDYGHRVRWTGTVWEWAPGDLGNNFFVIMSAAPSANGWILCNGAVTDYLVVGAAALAVAPITLPNPADGTFLKKLAAYTGAVDAAVAPGISGETADVGDSGGAGNMNMFSFGAAAGGHNVLDSTSTIIHRHGVGSLAVNAAGTPAALGGPLYFRR